jgi:hypothetical protein
VFSPRSPVLWNTNSHIIQCLLLPDTHLTHCH